MVHQTSSLGSIDLEWSNLVQSLQKLAFLDPFWNQNWRPRAQKYIFWLLECFKFTSGHIFHGMDRKKVNHVSCPASIDLKQLILAHSVPIFAFFIPQIYLLEPQNIFLLCLKFFKSYFGHTSYDLGQKNGSSSEFSRLYRP